MVGVLPLGVAAGFTEGCPRRGAEPQAALATPAQRDASPAQGGHPRPGLEVYPAGPANPKDDLLEQSSSLGRKIKKKNQSQTPA